MPPSSPLIQRIVFFGMPCTFSLAPLQAIIAAGYTVAAVLVTPEPGARLDHMPPIKELRPPPQTTLLPLINPYLTPTIVQVAWEHNIPVWELRRLGDAQTLATLAALEPELGVVACFSRRLPPPMLDLPVFGCLNVHPSLLPAYRGPAPLFWTFRDGLRTTGVTVHHMDTNFDTGDILLQTPVTLSDGCSGTEADYICSTAGAEALLEAIRALPRGTLQPCKQPIVGTYAPWPSAADFEISTTWSAQRAYNFICGTSEWGQFYSLSVNGKQIYLQAARAYHGSAVLGAPYVQLGSQVQIQFNPGVLTADLAAPTANLLNS